MSAADVANNEGDPNLVSGLNGCCKMIAAIASDPRHIDAVDTAGGLEAVLSATAVAQNHSDALCSCFSALIAMSRMPSLAYQIIEQDALSAVRFSTFFISYVFNNKVCI